MIGWFQALLAGGNLTPANTVLPVITGEFAVNEFLICSTGTWTNSPTSYTYQWKLDGVNISGETNSYYTVLLTDVGGDLSCTVTATNASGSASASSTETTVTLYTAGELDALDVTENAEVMFAYMQTFDTGETGNYIDESGNGRDITSTAQFMARSGSDNCILSNGASYFDLPNVNWQTLIIFHESASTTTGMLFRGAGTPTNLQCNYVGASTGSYLGMTLAEVRRDGRPITIANASYTRDNGVRIIGPSVIRWSPTSDPTAATRIGAFNTGNILSTGSKIYAIVGLNTSTPSTELINNIHNRLVKYKGVGNILHIPAIVDNQISPLPANYYNEGATQDADPGKVSLFGDGVPSGGLGVDGDRYVDRLTNEAYEKAAGSWGAPYITLDLPSPYTPYDHLIHTGVVDMGTGNAWSGYRYWLVVTPYPYRTDLKENPSVFCSNDGSTWYVPAGISNPLVTDPGGSGFNADVDIVYNSVTDEMAVIYKEWDEAVDEFNFILLKSSDGFQTFTATTLVNKSCPGLVGNEVAPTMFYDTNINKWVIYSIWENPVNGVLIRRISESWDSGFDDAVYDVCVTPYDFQTSDGMNNAYLAPWHINARLDSRVGGYVMMVGNSTTGGASGTHNGAVWTSTDGLTWYQSRYFLVTPTGSGWTGDRATYQGCLVATPTGFKLYNTAFSAVGDGNLPRMGEMSFVL